MVAMSPADHFGLSDRRRRMTSAAKLGAGGVLNYSVQV
jgi:hypothetical protein